MASPENPYLRDAPYFLKRAVAGIVQEEDGQVNLSHALDFALGVERVLKGILWGQHPGYTLTDEKFENMTKVFHADRLKKIGAEKQRDNANGDSITYRAAVGRARVFSEGVHQHYAPLMKLCHIRDVIAHNDLTILDLKDVTFFLRRNLHPILVSLADDGFVDAKALMGKDESLLDKMAVDYIDDLTERVEKRLARHKKLYDSKRTPVSFVHPVGELRFEQMDTEIDCPACGQKADVREEVDFDVVDGKAVAMGTFIVHLRCPNCRLFVTDYEELEEMGVTTEVLHPPEPDF